MIPSLRSVVYDLTSWPEVYDYCPPDIVYCKFYRTEMHNDIAVVKSDERLWCLRITYKESFPCPPLLAFVSAYNYSNEDPIWWPKCSFQTDPANQLMDVPTVADKTATQLGMSRGGAISRIPMSLPDFNKSDMLVERYVNYRNYMDDFFARQNILETGTNEEVYETFGLWRPEFYVQYIADRILG